MANPQIKNWDLVIQEQSWEVDEMRESCPADSTALVNLFGCEHWGERRQKQEHHHQKKELVIFF